MHCFEFLFVFIYLFVQVDKGTVACCISRWTKKQKSRSVTPLFESLWLWHSGVKTASCDSGSLRLSAKELFKAVQVHHQWLPGKIDARTALKDSSLEQSLGTEIEAHLWQSICDITHHGGNLRKDGRWKTQVAYSINPTYWKCSRTCVLAQHSKQWAGMWLLYFYSVLQPSLSKNSKHNPIYKWL